jgi:adenylate cyclase
MGTSQHGDEVERYPYFMVGDWMVARERGHLSRAGEIQHLEPKAMDVLLYLAAHQGEVVSREDLEKNVWRGALVGYDAVTKSVIKLRKAFGDQAREPGIIETIPKRGYRLVAPVRFPGVEEEHRMAGPDIAGEDSALSGRARSRPFVGPQAIHFPWWRRAIDVRATLIMMALAVLAGFATTLYLVWSATAPEAPSPPVGDLSRTPSIVVLPFDNLSDDPQLEAFSDGISEDIITDLSRLASLLVIASNTSFAFKGKRVSARELAADLNVDFVLEGSIRRHAGAVRVNARLVDARNDLQKWAKRYDRQVTDVFAVQDELTRSIVDALAINLSRQETERLARRTTNNLAAYDAFQEGQRQAKISTPDSIREAQAAYRKAIELDPDYGRAYGALAYTLAFNYRRGWTDNPQQTLERALEVARKAVDLDSTIPQTYWSLGFVHLMAKEYRSAEAATKQAIILAPNYADGYGLLALIKNALGEPESAIELIKKGMQLNPYYTWDYPYNLGRAYYSLGRIDEAIEALEAAKSRNENAVPIRLHLAASYARAGRLDDAQWEVEELKVQSPSDTISQQKAAHPIQDEVLMDAFVADLRAAGLPE